MPSLRNISRELESSRKESYVLAKNVCCLTKLSMDLGSERGEGRGELLPECYHSN